MIKLEQTLDSREVAKMVEKEHKLLLRDLRRYTKQLAECKIAPGTFFTESTYTDANNQVRPCYRVTKKGCEFIAHKLTGTKGTIFTAKYINRFHEMEDIIKQKEIENKIPWFIKKLRGIYVVLERDFIEVTGVDIRKHKAFYREEYFKGGVDWNGDAWYTAVNKEEFNKEHGFEYGDENELKYFYICGVRKALRILKNDNQVKMNPDAEKIINEGIKRLSVVEEPRKIEVQETKQIEISTEQVTRLPIQINIVMGKGANV